MHEQREIRAGKPRAPGMSKDTRYRVWGTLAAPTGMQPDGMAPVIHSAAFAGGFFMPKCPLARSPWIVRILCSACTRHHVEGDSQSAAPRPPCALEPTAGGGGAGGRSQAPRHGPTSAHEGW